MHAHAHKLLLSLSLLALGGCDLKRELVGETLPGAESGGSTTDGDPTGGVPATTTADPTPDPTTGSTSEPLDNPAGPCRPVDGDVACPADYICCSDDPATVGGRLPNYFTGEDDATFGPPIFSGPNNALSSSGQCVDVGEFPSPLASGCALPCNPRWTAQQRDSICGVGSMCCPFTEVDPDRDCVLDPDTNKWRSARGSDIPALTGWGDQHATNQDPTGTACEKFATVDGMVDVDVLADCRAQLGVADTRGFCYQACPCTEDLCDMKNPGWVPRCG